MLDAWASPSRNRPSIGKLLLRWLLLAVLLQATTANSRGETLHHVLVISSYHPGLNWTEEQLRGLRQGLQSASNAVEVHVEFLDTKRTPGTPAYWNKLATLFQEKYRNTPIAAVITQDDDALDFALMHRNSGQWLHGLPVVFSGVAGNREATLRNQSALSGVFDDADIAGNLALVRKLIPKLEQVIFIHDGGRSGQAQAASARQHVESTGGVRSHFLVAPRLSELPGLLEQYDPARSALFLLTFNRDPSGATFSHEEAATRIAAAARMPIFTKEDVSMVDGVLGGLMVTGYQQGRQAGEIAARILNGESTERTGMQKGNSAAIFDYREIQRLGIDERLLPTGEIRHRPQSLRETHPREFWLTLSLVGCLALLAIQFWLLWRRSQQARDALYASEERYRLLLRHSPIGILHYDRNLIVTYANEHFAELMGARQEQLVGFDLKTITDPRPLPACKAALAGEEGRYEGEYHVTVTQRTLSISTISAPARNAHGEVIGGINIVQDISARVEAEKAVRELNEVLEQRVEERTLALRKANEDMKTAMTQLAQTERLAALGSLVAGVAHELNTPIGNAYTVASTLNGRMQEMAGLLTGGSLKRSSLEQFMADIKAGGALIERNIERATSLIQNFKQVAVDQTSIRRRRFRLTQAVEEVRSMLNHQIRQTQLSLSIDIPEDIVLDSYPGPLDQILANLIQNSLLHGFEPDEPGEIRITARQNGSEVIIDYRDSGRGMPADIASRAFDPFFTTRLGIGGSGLGLYITRNLAFDALGGSLMLDTTPGNGVHFQLRIPLSAPATLPTAAL